MSYNLERFIKAQEQDYQTALTEIRNGFKKSHWMWYIFPQIKGLGRSEIAIYYSISNTEEAKAYMDHDILKHHLIEISEALLDISSNDPTKVMGFPDDLKLKSSMTLFAEMSPEHEVFQSVLDKFFEGKKDMKTLNLIQKGE